MTDIEIMLKEIDDLRAALVKSSEDVVNIARERNALKMSADNWFDIAVRLSKELDTAKKCVDVNARAAEDYWREKEVLVKEKQSLIKECTLLQEQITEMNLQYISDFGQLQEKWL